MELISVYLNEFNQEAETTRKMLSRIPDDKYDWKPHPKSMTIRQLATHIAELPSWIGMAINSDELDFEANPYHPPVINNTSELMDLYNRSEEIGRSHLTPEHENSLSKKWVLRSGDQVFVESTKGGVIRMALSQIIHHRAQLGVFLRLLDIPIPGSYGPSADEQ